MQVEESNAILTAGQQAQPRRTPCRSRTASKPLTDEESGFPRATMIERPGEQELPIEVDHPTDGNETDTECIADHRYPACRRGQGEDDEHRPYRPRHAAAPIDDTQPRFFLVDGMISAPGGPRGREEVG
jgi:hypothetical protein